MTYSGRLKVRSLVRHSSSEYFGVPELVVQELELHHLAGEVLDRADLVEQLPEALLDEPLERLQLELDQVGDGEDLGDPGIALARHRRVREGRRLSGRQHERPLLDGGRGEWEGRAHRTAKDTAIPCVVKWSGPTRGTPRPGPLVRSGAVGEPPDVARTAEGPSGWATACGPCRQSEPVPSFRAVQAKAPDGHEFVARIPTVAAKPEPRTGASALERA